MMAFGPAQNEAGLKGELRWRRKLLGSNFRGLSVGVILSTAVLAGGLALLGTASARADTTLLSLTNMPASGGTLYDLDFTATASTTTLSVAGYQLPSFWDAEFE